jgi:hypothetical protein
LVGPATVNWCALTGADRPFAKCESDTAPSRNAAAAVTVNAHWQPVEAVGWSLMRRTTGRPATGRPMPWANVGGTQTRNRQSPPRSLDRRCALQTHAGSYCITGFIGYPAIRAVVFPCSVRRVSHDNRIATVREENGAIDPSTFLDHADRKSKSVRPCA